MKISTSQKTAGSKGTDEESELAYLRRVERALREESERRHRAERVVRKQAAALASTRNVLLRSAAGRDFIPVFLRSMTRECDGVWATLWKVDDSAASGARAISFFPNRAIEAQVNAFVPHHGEDLRKLGAVYRSLAEDLREAYVLPANDARVPAEVRRFYEETGVANAVISPCLLGKRLFGWFSLLTEDRLVSSENVAFIHATAQQATLAMQLSELATTAGKAQQAMESERQARLREEEATEVTRLLRLTANSVDQSDGLESLFATAMRNITLLLRARTAALWTYNPDSESFEPVLALESGKPRRPDARLRRNLQRASGSRAELLRQWCDHGEIVVRPVSDDLIAGFLRQLGGQFRDPEDNCFMVVPLLFQDEVHGFFAAVGPEIPRPSDERSLAAKALGVQIALALRLDRHAGVQRLADLAEERNRIARDLHDLFAQALSGITLQVEVMRAQHTDLPVDLATGLERIREHALRSVEQVRRTLLLLRPEFLQDHTLPEALAALAADTRASSGLDVSFTERLGSSELASAVEINLFGDCVRSGSQRRTACRGPHNSHCARAGGRAGGLAHRGRRTGTAKISRIAHGRCRITSHPGTGGRRPGDGPVAHRKIWHDFAGFMPANLSPPVGPERIGASFLWWDFTKMILSGA